MLLSSLVDFVKTVVWTVTQYKILQIIIRNSGWNSNTEPEWQNLNATGLPFHLWESSHLSTRSLMSRWEKVLRPRNKTENDVGMTRLYTGVSYFSLFWDWFCADKCGDSFTWLACRCYFCMDYPLVTLSRFNDAHDELVWNPEKNAYFKTFTLYNIIPKVGPYI